MNVKVNAFCRKEKLDVYFYVFWNAFLTTWRKHCTCAKLIMIALIILPPTFSSLVSHSLYEKGLLNIDNVIYFAINSSGNASTFLYGEYINANMCTSIMSLC